VDDRRQLARIQPIQLAAGTVVDDHVAPARIVAVSYTHLDVYKRQGVYYYREPVSLPKDAVIHMRYHYDNSGANVRNRNRPPKRVHAGNAATDEMGHLWLQVLPRGPGDRRRELQEAVIEHRLERNPNDFEAHMNLGAIELARLNAQAAVTELREAVRLDATRPEPHNMLGLALASTGRNTEAIEQYLQALRLRPSFRCV